MKFFSDAFAAFVSFFKRVKITPLEVQPVLLFEKPPTAIEDMRSEAKAKRTSRGIALLAEVVTSPKYSRERDEALEALHSFKKKTKRSWESIGLVLPQNILDELKEITRKNGQIAKNSAKPTVKSRAHAYWLDVRDGDVLAAVALMRLKRSARRSWKNLGLNEEAGAVTRLLLTSQKL